MDLGIALKVVRDGLGRDVLDFDAVLLQLLEIGLKRAQVAAEHGDALLGKKAGHTDEQFRVVALHVPGAFAHALGVRERRRVHEDEIEAHARATSLRHPRHSIGALEAVLGAVEAVERHIAPRPIEVRLREIDRERAPRAASGRAIVSA